MLHIKLHVEKQTGGLFISLEESYKERMILHVDMRRNMFGLHPKKFYATHKTSRGEANWRFVNFWQYPYNMVLFINIS
jgi:hypothetical protein